MTHDKKRANPRVPFTRRCWCESGSTTIYAQLGNLSAGGVFVKTFAPLDQGAKATIRWELDDEGEEIEAEAVVVWQRRGRDATDLPPGMGLRFEKIERHHIEQIRSLVDLLDPEDPED